MPTVYVTAPREESADIAELLVEERLAACVNRLPVESTYRWEGEVVSDEETLLLAKTTEERYEDLVARVETVHPYDVPCVERFDEADVLESFGAWVADSV